MLYSQALNDNNIQLRLKDAGVDHIESPVLQKGDFNLEFDSLDDEVAKLIVEKEINIRKRHAEYDSKITPLKKKAARADAVRPHVEKLIRGKLADGYQTLENAMINHIAEAIGEKHDFTQTIEPKEDLTGFSELDRILKKSSITYLEQQVTKPEDMVLSYLMNSEYIKMLK